MLMASRSSWAQPTTFLGTQTLGGSRDYDAGGQSEAFQVTATSGGTLSKLIVYIDSSSSATTLYAGLYADASGAPGALLTSGSLSAPVSAAWNTVNVPSASISAAGKYWIAILGVGGTLRFRDQSSGPCLGQTNKNTGLTSLSGTWTAGTTYHDCPLSAYGTGSATAQAPVLSVSTNSVAFNMVVAGANPGATIVQVTNSGGGTIAFNASSDASWLSVSPASGSAPAGLQILATGAGMAVGTYTAHVTVTATGVQGSPQIITVTLTVSPVVVQSQPGDWLTIDHDPARTGFTPDETALTTSNVGTLNLAWSASLDGKVTAQPLFAGGITIGGVSRDVVIAATALNTIYALDAATGSVLWKRNLGAQAANCVFPEGFGITGAPVIDRANLRVFTVSSGGVFYSLSLTDGSILGQTGNIIPNPVTNSVWGGLNKLGNYVYFATGSNGCDTQPWQGTIYKIDVTSATPVVATSTPVVPGLSNTSDAGGGIWGYGGVAIDSSNGNLYVTAAADVNESTTPYANRLIVYDSNLNVLGSYLPSDPPTYPCDAGPCDLDFGSTPTVFTPSSCPQMVAGGKKNGNIYLFKTADLMASGQPTQILPINIANDSLGSGGAADPSFWSTGNMLFEGTAGPGANGFADGIVAMKVTNSCTLTAAWSRALGGGDNPNSTVTIANGIALIGVGQTGQVIAYNATDGTQLWQSPAGLGITYAAPSVAKGTVYVGSWNGYSQSDGGTVRAFSLSGNTFPATLTVSPTSMTFAAAVGGTNPATQTVSIGNSGNGAVNFTVASDSAWLSATPTSGSAPQTLTVSINIAGLSAGTLTGHLTVTANGALQSPQTITVTLNLTSGGGGGGGAKVLLGDQTIETQSDYNAQGVAEAFQATTSATGTASSISFYLNAVSNATQVVIGVYADAGGHPGALLSQAVDSQLAAGTWNTVAFTPISITQGSKYWIAILGSGGTVRFQDRSHGCSSETNSANNLTTLPATWTTGSVYTDCPISAYVSQ